MNTAPNGSLTALPQDGLAPLESILRTEELRRRKARPPDYALESRTLIALAEALANSPHTVLQTMAETMLEVFRCGSAGFSVLTRDGSRFHWPAVAGAWRPHRGCGTPRGFGPCGDVLDRDAPLLFSHWERRYPYLLEVTPFAREGLLVPFYVGGKAVGTIWVIAHDDRSQFDAEDLRLLESLGRFASAACRTVALLDLQREQRLAALNVMEDAVQARELAEDLNRRLGAEIAERERSAGLLVRQEEALGDSEAKYRAIFDGAAVSLWAEDFTGVKSAIEGLRSNGVRDFRRYFEEHPEFVQEAMGLVRILDVNDTTVKMFEARDKAELLGGLHMIFVPETLPVFIEELVTLAEGRTFMQSEALLKTVRGNLISVLFTMTLPPAGHKLDHVLFSLLDVTERSRLEKRTLEQAAALSDLHRRKDEFLAMLSHELRNPLAPIANAVHLLRLQRGSESQAEREARAIIERQVGQLTHLIDDLLEVSRITTGRLHLQQERIALAGIVEGAVETARPLIEQRRHTLATRVPPEPVWLYADAARLEQVVVNLLTNAAKYTDEGGEIRLGVEREGDAVVLRVRDTGVGIAPELLPRIFDLFTQAERGPDRSQGGLGIGLSLVQRLVELHGGTVEAHSSPGQGSEFVVRLPTAPAPSPPSPAPEPAPPDPGRCRVLVVDDNVDSAESLAMLLKVSGHDVQAAHDGEQALRAASGHPPDVALLDIGMPGLDGFEVAKRMREHPALRNVVLVALTGYGQDADRQRSREAGFDHHLVKPVHFAKLREILALASDRAKT